MNCEYLENNVLDYLDGVMNQQMQLQFEEHINNCSACNNLFTEIRATYSLTEEKHSIEVKEGFANELMDKLNKGSKTIQIPIQLKRWLIAASVAVAVISTSISAFAILQENKNNYTKSYSEEDHLFINELSEEPVEAMLLNESLYNYE